MFIKIKKATFCSYFFFKTQKYSFWRLKLLLLFYDFFSEKNVQLCTRILTLLKQLREKSVFETQDFVKWIKLHFLECKKDLQCPSRSVMALIIPQKIVIVPATLPSPPLYCVSIQYAFFFAKSHCHLLAWHAYDNICIHS